MKNDTDTMGSSTMSNNTDNTLADDLATSLKSLYFSGRDGVSLVFAEARLASISLYTMLVLALLSFVLLTGTWVSICVALFMVFTQSMSLASYEAYFLIAGANFFLLIIVILLIKHFAKNLLFSESRKALKAVIQ